MSQNHHISYNPEVTKVIPKKEHIRIHGHGTGRAKGEPPRGYNPTVIASRITPTLRKMVKFCVEKGPYISESEFVRVSIRQKLKRDAPHIYNKMFEEIVK